MLAAFLLAVALLACTACATTNDPDKGSVPPHLYVSPFGGEDVGDPESLMRLVTALYRRASDGDVHGYGFGGFITLEEFFEGNRDAASFGANLGTRSPHAAPLGWFDALRRVRSMDGVRALLVRNCQINAYEDGRLASWPYSDSVVVVTAHPRDAVLGWCEGLLFDDVLELSASELLDLDRSLADLGFDPVSASETAWVVWWD